MLYLFVGLCRALLLWLMQVSNKFCFLCVLWSNCYTCTSELRVGIEQNWKYQSYSLRWLPYTSIYIDSMVKILHSDSLRLIKFVNMGPLLMILMCANVGPFLHSHRSCVVTVYPFNHCLLEMELTISILWPSLWNSRRLSGCEQLVSTLIAFVSPSCCMLHQ